MPDNSNNDITLPLRYHPPYRWEAMLGFLDARSIPGLDFVKNGEYWRTAHFADSQGMSLDGWVGVGHRPEENALTVRISQSLQPALPQVLDRVERLLDLSCDPMEMDKTLSVMNDIQPGLYRQGTRVPGSFDSFEMAVRAVLGQQVTVKAARTLASRLTQAFGRPVKTGIEGLTHAFPQPADLLNLQGPIDRHLGPLGIITSRAKCIRELASALQEGRLDLSPSARPEAEIRKLVGIRGIGKWTAHYIAMRTMGYADAFLETDVGVKQVLSPRSSQDILKMAEAWRPWRSYATLNIWNARQDFQSSSRLNTSQ